MALYKGRDVQILHDATTPVDHKVVIQLADGETKVVHKGEVTVFDTKEVPTPPVVKGEKPLSTEELHVQHYRKPTQKEIKDHEQRIADKKAKDLRMAQYSKDGLSPAEIDTKEAAWLAANPVVQPEVKKA